MKPNADAAACIRNDPIPQIHDLAKLLSLIGNETSFAVIQEASERLTTFRTMTRYPGGVYSLSAEQLPSILKWASDIGQYIRTYFDLSKDL